MSTDERLHPQDLPPHRGGPRHPRSRREVPAAVGVFVVVLLSLQVFLLTVGLDALLADDDGLAWVTAGLSVLLAPDRQRSIDTCADRRTDEEAGTGRWLISAATAASTSSHWSGVRSW